MVVPSGGMEVEVGQLRMVVVAPQIGTVGGCDCDGDRDGDGAGDRMVACIEQSGAKFTSKSIHPRLWG